ncbi:dynein beta chain, ciliary-like [Trematomus bernacchii]|uniref:dynein beta chain, ciliary-like n=1 Tax=Trematomus bernacchii TaxID=40690 RepID=UPI00146CC5EC|nr:dynein beta chain, ciliary-like [Trematomus bernacchii]
MMHTALTFLCDSMSPKSCSVFLTVSLQLQETGSVFEPSVGGGLSDLLQSFINDVYSAASLPPRISDGHHGNYQVCLQQEPRLSALEQEVMRLLQKVKEEAELLQVKMDRYSYLWQSDRRAVMQEFLTYSRQLGPEELEAPEAPPTLKDFQRELQALSSLQVELSHLDEQRLLGWLKVELRPFRDSLLSIIQEWSDMYTQHLLSSVSTSLQQVTQHADEDSSSSSGFPVTETLLLLEATGVQLPEHLSAQLQC